MASIEDVIQTAVLAGPASIWTTVWTHVVDAALAGHALTQIDFASATVEPGLLDLDDATKRSSMVPVSNATTAECVRELVQQRRLLNQAITAAGFGSQSERSLRIQVGHVMSFLLAHSTTQVILATTPFPRMWRALGHTIAADTWTILHGPQMPEWLLMHRLLLAGYFATCEQPEAKLVLDDLAPSNRKLLGLRGSLIRIPEQIGEDGILDKVPASTARQGGVTLAHTGLTSLLQATQNESQQLAAGRGVLHRLMQGRPVPPIPRWAQGRVTQQHLLQGRDMAFRQYEYHILAYMALGCIEQLLRGQAERWGVPHIRPNGVPRPTHEWFRQLRLSGPMLDKLSDLYEDSAGNIRNRIMHAGLLELESRRLELSLTIANPSRYPAGTIPSRTLFSHENICQLCLDCLASLDAEVAIPNQLTSSELAWVQKIGFTPDELKLGQAVYCDFLGPDAEAWQRYVQQYLSATMPSVNQLFVVGFIGWVGQHQPDRLVRFVAMSCVFEAVFRLTVHLLGHRSLQIDKTNGRVQYLMLDGKGLCHPEVISHLVEGLTPDDAKTAQSVLLLAVKARNLFSHGAITTFTNDDADAIGHCIVKTTQLLVSCGRRHMAREAAYYEYLGRGDKPGSALDDWLTGEKKALALVRAAAGA